MKQFQMIACVFFALTLSAWLGRAEMHADDTGILVGLIGIGGLILSLIEPKRPWMWGMIVPSGIILVELWRRSAGVLAIAGFTIAIGCAGAYAGAFIRRHASSVR